MSMDELDGCPAARKNGMAIASLLCAIVGLLILEIILGPLAIIFGAIGLSRANKGAPNRGLAVAGLLIGGFDVLVFLLLIALATSHGTWHI